MWWRLVVGIISSLGGLGVVMAAMPMMEKNKTFGTELGECDVCTVLLREPHGVGLRQGMYGKTFIFSTQDTEALLCVSLGCKTLSG